MKKIKLSLISLIFLFYSGCSLSGKIKSAGSQTDDTSPVASPVASPVTGSDELRVSEPTEYIKPSNQSSYLLSGSCKSTNKLVVEVNNTIVQRDVACTNETFSITIDLGSVPSGEVSIKVYVESLPSVESTVSIIKDSEAPLLIGTVTDGSYLSSTTQTPNLTWVAGSDAHSGIKNYEIAIGTSAGGVDVLNWMSTNSTNISHIQTGLSLTNGVTYFASLRAIDNADNISNTIQSDGWIVDSNAPSLATDFSDGGEINFSTTSTKLMNWVASSDAVSGILGYEIALGTTAGGTDILNWTSVGNVITETIDSLTLFGNRRYYASLRSVDVVGNRTASVMSDGWWNLRQSKKAVDVTNPQVRSLGQSAVFGGSVAISEDGNTLVIGSSGDDTDVNGNNHISNAGSAFVYVKSAGVWVLQQKLVATGTYARVTDDLFGSLVAISGDTIVVGAPQQDYDASGSSPVLDAGAVFVFVRSAGVWSQQQKLVATGTNSRIMLDTFGRGLAITGDTIVVGSSQQDFDANGGNSVDSAGAAYVFVRSAGVWSQQQKLVATGTNARVASDLFGNSVAISGETIVVGANQQDFDANGNNSVSSAGAAYVYVRSAGVWTQQQKLVATGTNARVLSHFGNNVDISGETIVVGANWHSFDASGNNSVSTAGAAYVFVRSAGVWSQQQKLVATGTNARVTTDFFGQNVSISGETIVIGAYWQDFDATGANSLTDAGAAYVFVRSVGVWSQQQKLVATGTNARVASDQFGSVVAISGETIVVGARLQDYDVNGANISAEAGAAYTFLRSASTWSQEQKIVDEIVPASRMDLVNGRYSSSISISEDGNTLVVGASGDDTDANGLNYLSAAGAVYVYIKSAGAWTFQQKLVATGTNARGGWFGHSVAISGETIVVGAVNHTFDANGDNSLTGAGAAFVFVRSAGVWSQQQKLVATGTNARVASDEFGESVAISDETIVVGAHQQDYDDSGNNSLSQAGAAYVFVRSAGVWSQQQKLVATGTNARVSGDFFGYGVAISSETIVVGAYGQDYDESGTNSVTQAGAAYVYVRSAGVWSQQQKLVASGTNARLASDEFGRSVAISGETIVVGAHQQDYDANGDNVAAGAGAAYVYVRSAGVWSQQQKLVATGTNARVASDFFGINIAISGETIVVSAHGQDYDANGDNSLSGAGAAYVFRRTSTTWGQELKLVPTGTNSRLTNMNFGRSVVVTENQSNDGYTIGVGAIGDSYDSTGGGNMATSAGSVFIFD
jgi:hypothetical protein